MPGGCKKQKRFEAGKLSLERASSAAGQRARAVSKQKQVNRFDTLECALLRARRVVPASPRFDLLCCLSAALFLADCVVYAAAALSSANAL
jgi:hypothetical protein